MKTHGIVAHTVAGVVALALSGIAIADHKPGHDKGNAQGPGPNTSIEVVNLCEPAQENAGEQGKFLRVTSTITNETGDGVEAPVEIGVSQVQVAGFQFVQNPAPPKKKTWIPAGSVVSTPDAALSILPGESKDYVVHLELCGSDPVLADATALNAEVQIMIDGRNFAGQCDNPVLEGDDPDPDDGIAQDINDQSRIDIADYPWLSCP